MRGNKFTLIINRDNVIGTFYRDINRRGIRRGFLLTMLVFIGAIVLLFLYSDNVRKRFEIYSLEISNEQQQSQLTETQERIGELNQKLTDISSTNDFVRLAHALPTIPEAERLGGIGGVELGQAMSGFPTVDYSALDETTQRYYERALRLEGSISLESSLLVETIERTRRERDIRSHTPSIKPVVGHIVSYMGNRIHPITGLIHFHRGVDIVAAWGTPIFAPADGVVSFAGTRGGYGTTCFIDHGYGIQTRYGHTSKLHVKVGDVVERGQIIADIGTTGMSTGPHLHFEVIIEGSVTDPMAYITPDYEFD
ncbi:M23 family metallopeptidase [bacterium]|nr:M23 family metallopeptidase [bacterium]